MENKLTKKELEYSRESYLLYILCNVGVIDLASFYYVNDCSETLSIDEFRQIAEFNISKELDDNGKPYFTFDDEWTYVEGYGTNDEGLVISNILLEKFYNLMNSVDDYYIFDEGDNKRYIAFYYNKNVEFMLKSFFTESGFKFSINEKYIITNIPIKAIVNYLNFINK